MDMNYFFMFIYFSGLFVFIMNFNHFLLLLLSLEFIMLSVFTSMFFMLSFELTNLFFCMIYLTIVVCEGVLGLSVMVKMIRSVGNEYILSFTLLW